MQYQAVARAVLKALLPEWVAAGYGEEEQEG
jgi:hypothetical protein